MPKKPRKMLGDAKDPCVVVLLSLMDSQSRETLCAFGLGWAEENILPIFEKHCPNDRRPQKALTAARDYLDGKIKFPVLKYIILNECHAAARELEDNPPAQAAARACGQAAAMMHTLSHALGLYFYGAAALAYDSLGVNATEEAYQIFARAVCAGMTAGLQKVAVQNEPHPAKIKWHC